MIKLALLLIGFVPVLSFAASAVLLRYEYGNQITRSELTIHLDGTIKRAEKRGGGQPAEAQPDVMLTPESRRRLFESIHEVSLTAEVTGKGQQTALGSSSGSLVAYSRDHEFVIRRIERGEPKPGALDKVTYNPAPQARWIEKLVLSLVENRMYLEAGN